MEADKVDKFLLANESKFPDYEIPIHRLDRFLIGDWGKGIIKLLTGGGLGIWYIIDWFLIVRATKRKNMERLEEIINHP